MRDIKADDGKSLELAAHEALENKEYSKALALFSSSVAVGNYDSLFMLAYCHDCGLGTAKSRIKALQLYKRSMLLGKSKVAYCNIAIIFREIGNKFIATQYFWKSIKLQYFESTIDLFWMDFQKCDIRNRKTLMKYLQCIYHAKPRQVSEYDRELASAILARMRSWPVKPPTDNGFALVSLRRRSILR
jgi:TPR repeat protein